jgi:hypothetical protein
MSNTSRNSQIVTDVDRARIRKRAEALQVRLNDLATAGEFEEPETIQSRAEYIRSQIVDDRDYTPAFKKNYLDALKEIERDCCLRITSLSLDRANDSARDRRKDLKERHLTRAKNVFAIALKLGASETEKDRVRKRIEIIVATDAAGESIRGKTHTTTAADLREAHPEQKLRRYLRFRDPALVAKIGGQTYETVDWSLGGASISDIKGDLAPGSPITVRLSVADDDFEIICGAIALKKDKNDLIIRFTEDKALLPIVERCKKLGVNPSA